MDLHIDTLYLNIDSSTHSYITSNKDIIEYKSNYYIYTYKYNKNDTKVFKFEYQTKHYTLHGDYFKISCYKLGKYRLELIGLHQYNKDGTLKSNRLLERLHHFIKYSYITRIDLCKDSKARPHQKKLITKKAKYCGTTLYHNLYSRNYFSSYTYDKQSKNGLELPMWRTEYSFKRILSNSNRWKFQHRHLSKMIRNCERFIDKLEGRAEKIRTKEQ